MVPFPNTLAPFVDIKNFGRILRPWVQFLQQFVIAPPNIVPATVGGSPYSFIAKEPGTVFVDGGTVTAIHLIRGSIDLDLTGQKLIPVGINDTVITSYSVLPTLQFIPAYGQNTNG